MSSGAPCGACKFLRRKCVRNCIFAPYFTSEQGAARFAAVHKVFGASNVSKLLQDIPVAKRCDAVLTISYEAQARLSDPVYGCVATIVALQHQVASLQAELASIQSQLSKCMAAAAAAAQQQQRQHMSASYDMQQNLAINSLSMALPGTSSSGGYSRVKEEGPYHPVHNYEIGMPSSLDLMHNIEALQHKHTTRTSPNGDPEELQALAHALLGRK